MKLTRAALLSMFRVEVRSGKLFWKTPPRTHPRLLGRDAGSNRCGRGGEVRRIIKIDGKGFPRSRLMFFLSRRRWPKNLVDHRNGRPLDDRPSNLRDATKAQNARNHRPRRGRKLPAGVRLWNGRYEARITCDGRQYFLGGFDNPLKASRAYRVARKELFGEFA